MLGAAGALLLVLFRWITSGSGAIGLLEVAGYWVICTVVCGLAVCFTRETGAADSQSLANIEARFRQYTEASPSWFWETDAEHRLTFISSRYFDVSGALPEEVLGKRREELRSVAGSEADQATWRDYQQALTRHQPFRNLRYTTTFQNGSTHTFSTSGAPHFDRHGKFCGYRGTAVEVGEGVR